MGRITWLISSIVHQRLKSFSVTLPFSLTASTAARCRLCGDPIPEPRRATMPGCQTCAECQSVIELKNKQRGDSVNEHGMILNSELISDCMDIFMLDSENLH